MKAVIFAAIMILAASVKASTCEDKNSIRNLSSDAEEIQNATTPDYREVIDRTTPEFKDLNGIGVVTHAHENGYGSGFLVSPCHVLTNLHVAFDDVKNPKDGQPVEFSVGQTGSAKKPFSNVMVPGKVVAYGGYRGLNNERNGDWAVIKLSKPVGNSVGFIKLYQMSFEAMKQRPVITAGFPGSKNNNGKDYSKLYGDLNCKMAGVSVYGYVAHTCQATAGQSGSPILAKAPNDGKFYAIAMVAGRKSAGNGMDRIVDQDKGNMAVSFDSGKLDGVISEGDKIVEAINANKCD